MNKTFLLASIFCTFLPLMIVFCLTPYITKKDALFGVLLPKDAKKTEEMKKISRNYTVFSIISAILLALTTYCLNSHTALGICLVTYIALCLLYYLMNNRLMQNIIELHDYENLQKDVYVKYVPEGHRHNSYSLWWALFLLVPVAATIALSYNADVPYAYIIPVIQIAASLLVFIILLLVRKSGHYVDKHDIQASIHKNVRFRKKWYLVALISGIAINTGLAAVQAGYLELVQATTLLNSIPFILAIAVTIFTIIMALQK